MQVDPLAVSASNYSPYAYANLNPVLFNDPLGLLTLAQFDDIIRDLMNSPYGGKWSQDGGYREYDSELDAFNAGIAYMDAYGMWGGDGGRFAHNFESAAKVFATSSGNPMPLREVTIKETRTNANWLQERIDEVLYKVRAQTQGGGPGDPSAGEESSWLERLWNSDYVRSFIPDVYTIDVSVSAAVGRGRRATYALNFITRGKKW